MSTSAAARDTFQSCAFEGFQDEAAFDFLDRLFAHLRVSAPSVPGWSGARPPRAVGGWRISDGQLGRTDDGRGAQQADPVHDILEFPHVAGPGVVHQQLQGFGRDLRDFLSGFFAELFEEVQWPGPGCLRVRWRSGAA